MLVSLSQAPSVLTVVAQVTGQQQQRRAKSTTSGLDSNSRTLLTSAKKDFTPFPFK